ncbi:hypothetical protein [Chitinophaga sp. HK235]|uniref:hypothetical protein n=1 Tax=Chitinophaga sp. HK235 TaxID=2952571 RepID=UPI001BA447ED|nr:hypothetical protein [Chitinophaga sp. HK235]
MLSLKASFLKILEHPTAILAAKKTKTPFEKQMYMAFVVLGKGIQEAPTEEELELWLSFMWDILERLGLSKE